MKKLSKKIYCDIHGWKDDDKCHKCSPEFRDAELKRQAKVLEGLADNNHLRPCHQIPIIRE